jgi:glycosyltransferase involved in cell wall biosynthesis
VARTGNAMRISCIIPLYNAEKYLAETLDSVIAQDWPLHEIIVVDDGSTDDSRRVLDRYAEFVRLIEQPHAGVAAARNRGLREATGDVIAFQDSDDLWPPGRLRRLAESLQDDDSVDIVAGRVEVLDERAVKPRATERLETMHRPMMLASLLIRPGVFGRVGFFNERLNTASDTEFIMRCRRLSIPSKKIDATTLIYRLHTTNISRDIDRNFSNTVDALRVISSMRRKS